MSTIDSGHHRPAIETAVSLCANLDQGGGGRTLTPNVAKSLDNYAALLRETGRADEAAEMEARAKAIRAKYE